MKKTAYAFILLLLFISCRDDYKSFKSEYGDDKLKRLLHIAKQSILVELKKKSLSHFVQLNYSDNDTGIIIRLKKRGKERGCIAYIKGVASLDIGAETAALNAAFFDSRFHPLKEEELKYLEIEAGIIGKFTEIKNKRNFKLGIDSLLLEDPLNRTFLQGKIAVEDRLNKTQFLNALCRKAGLKEGSYMDKKVKIYKAYTVYYTEKFID